MNEDLKITKEDLVLWLDRPPSNDDLDLCSYLSNAVENQYKYYQENKQLKEQIKEIKEYIYNFIKHSSYGKKEIDEAIHQEFYNIILIIKYAKEELKGEPNDKTNKENN